MSIYLDYNASAPIDSRVLDAMIKVYKGAFGNADSRTHNHGEKAREVVEHARKQIADLLGVTPGEVFFTSGSTESNNIAIRGLEEYAEKTGKKHIITSGIEHKAVLETVKAMGKKGFKIDIVNPDLTGRVDTEKVLSNVVITENDGSGWPRRLDANVGEWSEDDGCWVFHNVVMFRWDPEKNLYAMSQQKMLVDESYDQTPDSFRNISRNVEEMERNTAKAWIETLRKAGLPYREALTEYYKRFSFTFTPLIVALISISFTGKFRKNVLLMSLLSSMMIAAGYYILQMVLMLFAKMGYIPPLAGAWGALFTFIILSLIMLKNADT